LTKYSMTRNIVRSLAEIADTGNGTNLLCLGIVPDLDESIYLLDPFPDLDWNSGKVWFGLEINISYTIVARRFVSSIGHSLIQLVIIMGVVCTYRLSIETHVRSVVTSVQCVNMRKLRARHRRYVTGVASVHVCLRVELRCMYMNVSTPGKNPPCVKSVVGLSSIGQTFRST